MNFNNVDTRLYMKSDEPQTNDLFVVVRQNDHQTPYLIFSNGESYSLLNLHSGQSNYNGINIQDLILHYLSQNANEKLNPIKYYFFTKGHKTRVSITETFGYNYIQK